MASGKVFYPARQILPNLWIGSEGDSGNPRFMTDHDIHLVVNCSRNIPSPFASSIQYVHVPVDDSPDENHNLLERLPAAVVAIDDALSHGLGVLVHCHAGMQRSASVVAGYLMWKQGLGADNAMRTIKTIKTETFEPRPTFTRALRDWQTMLDGGNGRVPPGGAPRAGSLTSVTGVSSSRWQRRQRSANFL